MANLFGDFLKNMPEVKLDDAQKKLLLISLGAMALILLVYFFLLLRPTLGTLMDIAPRVQKLRIEIKAVQNDLEFEDRLKAKRVSLEDQLKLYANKLSRERELPSLLEDLSKKARTSNIKIRGITPQDKALAKSSLKAKESKVYQEHPISVIAESGYHQLGTFVNKLENNERFMRIADIHIKANKANPKRHDVEFVVCAYTFKENNE
ncbi:MAG: type 4a pilus biogenesis protein PilO [Candidatus Omnitrophica bacterium]|nr:type 4a pilus biogenesis protein PilO [Candidatus Omnitrophota bacterium]